VLQSIFFTSYYLGEQILIMSLAGNVMCMGEMRNAHNILAGKPEGKRLLDSPEHRREDVDLKEIVCEDVEWIHLALDVAM
jgi:hypothetical protein